jgi:preprotein translocase subunit SecA
MDSLGDSVEDVAETLSGELVGLYEEKEQEYGAELLREVEQSVMLQVIDSRWLEYLTQMDHLREGMGFQAYGQMDPLVEYKAAAFSAFQDLTEDIQREIVRALLNVQIRRVDPNATEADGGAPAAEGAEPAAQAPTAGAAEAVAPASPRADRPGGATDGAMVPPARPAAALASGALARATATRVSAPVVSKPIVRNIVESSSTGTRRVDGTGNGSSAAGNGSVQGKVGRNQACPCGSGKKYKYCHGK